MSSHKRHVPEEGEDDDTEPESVKRARIKEAGISIQKLEDLVTKLPDIAIRMCFQLDAQTIMDLCSISHAFQAFCTHYLSDRFWRAIYMADVSLPYLAVETKELPEDDATAFKERHYKEVMRMDAAKVKSEYKKALRSGKMLYYKTVMSGKRLMAWIEGHVGGRKGPESLKADSSWEGLTTLRENDGLFTELEFVDREGYTGFVVMRDNRRVNIAVDKDHPTMMYKIDIGTLLFIRTVIMIAPDTQARPYAVEKKDVDILWDDFSSIRLSASRMGKKSEKYEYWFTQNNLHILRIYTDWGSFGSYLATLSRPDIDRFAREAMYLGTGPRALDYKSKIEDGTVMANSLFSTSPGTISDTALVSNGSGMVRLYNRSQDTFPCNHWFHKEDFLTWIETLNQTGESFCPLCE